MWRRPSSDRYSCPHDVSSKNTTAAAFQIGPFCARTSSRSFPELTENFEGPSMFNTWIVGISLQQGDRNLSPPSRSAAPLGIFGASDYLLKQTDSVPCHGIVSSCRVNNPDARRQGRC